MTKSTEDVFRESIAYIREHYDESIFPPRPKGVHTEVYDGEAAAVARRTCDNILREFNRRMKGEPDGYEVNGMPYWLEKEIINEI